MELCYTDSKNQEKENMRWKTASEMEGIDCHLYNYCCKTEGIVELECHLVIFNPPLCPKPKIARNKGTHAHT